MRRRENDFAKAAFRSICPFNVANVNSLKSFDTELPFEYYTMPFCRPSGGIKRIADTANPGTILEGLRIENSPYNFTMKAREIDRMAHGAWYHSTFAWRMI